MQSVLAGCGRDPAVWASRMLLTGRRITAQQPGGQSQRFSRRGARRPPNEGVDNGLAAQRPPPPPPGPSAPLPSLRERLALCARPAAFCAVVGVGGFAAGAAISESHHPVSNQAREYTRMSSAQRAQYYSRNTKLPITEEIALWWRALPDSYRVLGGTIAGYLAVYGVWKVPRLAGFAMRNLVHDPFAGRLRQLVTCHFSHYSIIQLGFNSFALWSFGAPILDMLGQDQFLGFAVGAGMGSALLSQCHSVLTGSRVAGLGASGVIMGLISLFAVSNPDAIVYVPFAPFIQGSALAALGVIVAIDVAGLALGWKVLGHAAHLGGSSFGLWYAFQGKELLWDDMKLRLRPLGLNSA